MHGVDVTEGDVRARTSSDVSISPGGANGEGDDDDDAALATLLHGRDIVESAAANVRRALMSTSPA